MKFKLFTGGTDRVVCHARLIKRLLPWAKILGLLLLSGNIFGAVELQTVASFDPLPITAGHSPTGPLIQAKDGSFYGTASAGGGALGGSVFKITPSGQLSVAATTGDTGFTPGEGLVLGGDGNFYGTTLYGGSASSGSIFKMTPKGKLSQVASFAGTNGLYPICLILGADGNFYGTAWMGGGNVDDYAPLGHGTVFKLTPTGELTAVFAFAGTNGGRPISLIQGMDGNLYGLTAYGGSAYETNAALEAGTVFQLTTNGLLTTLCEFGGDHGNSPETLMQASDGNLYGTTYGGGGNNGSIFRLTTNGQFTALHNFSGLPNGQNFDGANPMGRLYQGRDGCLYGGTRNGGTNLIGASGYGTFYKITTNGDFYTLCSVGVDSSPPFAGYRPNGLIEDRKGNFFGTTQGGGTNDSGTVVKLVVARPILAITQHLRDLSSDSATISGSARAKFGSTITGVRYQLNGSDWTDANTSDGFAHWTVQVQLSAGKNVFKVYTVDSAGDCSRTNSLKLQLPRN
jgi:uncharacterized repeat protein (TIGR03803 family)